MSTRIYSLPTDQTQWHVPGGATTIFNWEYDVMRDAFEEMGVIDFQDVNADDLAAADEELARDLDRRREAAATAALAGIDQARAAEVEATIEAGAQD
jgi:hypothetical protein